MQTGKNTVDGIFDATRIFNVPIYQRAYAWEVNKHLIYFLSDLLNQPESEDRPYFFGSFLFHLNGKRGEFQVIDIVDGQQRLTTFIIFMKVLIGELQIKGSTRISERTIRKYILDDDTYKLELTNEDSAFLHNYILGDKSMNQAEIKTPSQRLLIAAKEYFAKELIKLDLISLEKIYGISTKADVLLYVVEKINTATQIFELLNDRGKKLTDLEAIKSFLMYNIGLVSNNPEQLIKNIQSNFGEIYRIIEKYDIDDSEVLRYHTIAFEKDYETNAKEFIKKKVTASLKFNPPEITKELISNYSMQLKESFELYKSIRFNEGNSINLNKLFMIGRVGPFYPVMMKVKRDLNDAFEELLINIVDFTFKAAMTNLKSNGESYLYSSIKHNENLSIKIKSFTENNWWNINNRAKEVLKYVNYFDWINKNVVKYILFSYENKLRNRKGFAPLTIDDYFSSNSREKISIEHISAKKALGIVYDNDFNINFLNSIGNLVLDSVASNSSKKNNNTEDKLEALNNAPLMSQNEIDDAKCDWHEIISIKEFIKQREIKLKTYISDTFDIELLEE